MIANYLTKFIQYFQKPLFFICNDPLWALGLEHILPDYHIICIDHKGIVEILQKRGISVFCLEQELGKKNILFRNSVKLLQHPLVIQYIKTKSNGKMPQIVAFKPSAAMFKYCQSQKYGFLASNYALNFYFEDKISFSKFLVMHSLPQVPFLIVSLKIEAFSKLVKKLGLPFVLQFGHGFAGTSTFLVKNKREFNDLVEQNPNKKAKITSFIEGFTLTINACVTKQGVLLSPFCFQITGYQQYTASWGGTCGTSWQFPALPPCVGKKIYDLTTKIGQLMAGKGFKGIFGLDFLLDKKLENIYVIEDNARMVASIPLFTEIQLLEKQIPFFMIHLLELLNADYNFDIESANRQNLQPLKIAQLIMRNTEPKEKIISQFLATGIYNWRNSSLLFKKSGYSLTECKAEQDIIILPASKGQKINPAIEYARLRFQQPILDQNWQLLPWIHDLANDVKQNLWKE